MKSPSSILRESPSIALVFLLLSSDSYEKETFLNSIAVNFCYSFKITAHNARKIPQKVDFLRALYHISAKIGNDFAPFWGKVNYLQPLFRGILNYSRFRIIFYGAERCFNSDKTLTNLAIKLILLNGRVFCLYPHVLEADISLNFKNIVMEDLYEY